ncbi:MAG: hypothetical protein K2X55_03790 [Burkholderiaceae bacterium]|nr:hypothetical protein [Burkholderiaceae bacterium]
MKTFAISAIAFYFFYILNGLMAPGHAARQQQSGACQEAMTAESGSNAASLGTCKSTTMVARSIAAN